MRISDERIRIIKAAELEKYRFNGFFCLCVHMKFDIVNALFFVHENDMFMKNER